MEFPGNFTDKRKRKYSIGDGDLMVPYSMDPKHEPIQVLKKQNLNEFYFNYTVINKFPPTHAQFK